jgi:hypothetical protein
LQAKLKPLFSTKAFLLKHSLSSQNILIIPSSLTLHSYRHNSTIDLGRIFKIPYIINIPYHANPHKKSTSEIPSTSFQNAEYTTNIPKPVYTDLEQPSPPTSPTFSAVTENI